MRYSEKVEAAVAFAKKAHEGQVRKGTTEPYFGHVMEVMEVVAGHGASEAVMMAAVLHDSYEDAGVKPAEVAERFGAEVAAMVSEVTEPTGSPRPAYEVRKAAYLAAMAVASPGAAMVSAGDKLVNARSIVKAHAEVGPAVFERFRKGKAGTMVFYRAVAEVLKPKVPAAMAAEVEEAVAAMERL